MMSREPIHSGHFMTSDPHKDPAPDDEDGELEVDVVEDDDKPEDLVGAKDPAGLDEKPVTFYKFGPKKTQSIAIDVSLNKLNKCIKVAYNKMTTPRWKDFKGLKLHWKQRIRLNNVIWRAYYIEFGRPNRRRMKLKKSFCYFSVPDDDTTHSKIEGSVLEGMYWKRRMGAVCAQYKRWRSFIKSKKPNSLEGKPLVHSSMTLITMTGQQEPAQKRKRHASESQAAEDDIEPPMKRTGMTPNHSSSPFFDVDDLENVFTDCLFDSLNQPFMFPDRGEMMSIQHGNPDIMQPVLLSLQPSLEEIMATLEEPEANTRISLQNQPSTSAPLVPPPQLSRPAPETQPIVPPSTRLASAANAAPPTAAVAPQQVTTAPVSNVTRRPQDYAVASMLVDYSNQPPPTPPTMPTRQSSSITSQMLMLSSQGVQPQYSTAMYDTRSWKPSIFGDSNSSTSTGTVTPTSLDYLPNFLQTQAGLLSSQPISSGTPLSISSMRSWWLDSPLATQSPLSVITPLGNQTPLAPATPMGLSLGPATPPSLRSPVITQNDSLGRTDGILKPSTTLTERLEQPSLLTPKLETKDWNRPLASTSYSPLTAQRSAPATTEPRTTHSNPWKTPNIQQVTPIYQAYNAEPAIIDQMEPGPSSIDNMMLKEEPVLSAPPSVKVGRGSSRQVQADSTLHPEERKRILHLHAEQNRRTALKDGFDQLMEMIPNLYSGGVKPTNAVVLAKSADHIRRMVAVKDQQQAVKDELQAKIARLNQKISALQTNLPSASGLVPTKLEPKAALENFHDRYVKERSKKDWRFWVMAKMLHPLTVGQSTSFASQMSASDGSREELVANCSDWLNKHWRGPEIRPLASTLLVHLATNTDVLSHPESLGDYVKDQLKNPV